MAENYLIDDVSNGEVRISEEVIATIAVVAIEEIEGITLQTSLKNSVTDILGVKTPSKGVKVNIGEHEALIDVFITVDYGKNLIEVGKEVQAKVNEAVEMMTGLKVVEVNVHISGINIESKDKVKA